MTNKTDFSKPYWFYLSPKVYVSQSKADTKMLLYNTSTGEHFEVIHKNCIELIKEVYKPDNLGVVKLPVISTDNQNLTDFVETVIKLDMGGLMNVEDEKRKPINMLPILSLSKDIEKLKNNDEISLIVPDLISYLSELTIYINGKCMLECSECMNYYKQIKACSKFEEKTELHPDMLQKLFDQLEYSRVKKINITGGNIYQYTQWNTLTVLLKEYDFDFHFWINYLNIPKDNNFLSLQNIISEILVTFPIQKKPLEQVLKLYKANFKLHFLIENEVQYSDAINIIEYLEINNYNIVPIYTGNNGVFFSKNIFLEKEDIFSSVISMREIFRNQKLNANNFGILTILPDGSVKANVNTGVIGNIYQNTILELIYKELIDNTAWRVIRDKGVCSNCLYQFICPPPSNYEAVIGKSNLCHIHS